MMTPPSTAGGPKREESYAGQIVHPDSDGPSAAGTPMKLSPWKPHRSRREKDFRGQGCGVEGKDPVIPVIRT